MARVSKREADTPIETFVDEAQTLEPHDDGGTDRHTSPAGAEHAPPRAVVPSAPAFATPEQLAAFAQIVADALGEVAARLTNIEVGLRIRESSRQAQDGMQCMPGFSPTAYDLIRAAVRDALLTRFGA